MLRGCKRKRLDVHPPLIPRLASPPRLRCSTSWRPAWAQTTHSANVTFVLINDIYLMGEQPFPDGKTRGGFARLAAVVKAERERRAPKAAP